MQNFGLINLHYELWNIPLASFGFSSIPSHRRAVVDDIALFSPSLLESVPSCSAALPEAKTRSFDILFNMLCNLLLELEAV